MKKVKFELMKAPHVDRAPKSIREFLSKPISAPESETWDFTETLELWVDETETGAELKSGPNEVIARFNDIKGIDAPFFVIRSFTDRMKNVFCSDDLDNLNNIILEVIS